jgi:fucose 4-O-acetylase-like acetyltransferase
MAETKRLQWIDHVRGVLMLFILLFHTEVYYASHELIPYHIYVQDVLAMFFFISGYLFQSGTCFSLSHKLRSVFTRLLLPYFLFTLLMAPLKLLAYGTALTSDNVFASLCEIVQGQASWFIAALIVAELVLALVISVSDTLVKPLLIISLCLSGFMPIGGDSAFCNLWHWQEALLALPIICCGYITRRHEDHSDSETNHLFDCHFSRKALLLLSALSLTLLALLKLLECHMGYTLTFSVINVSNYFVFYADIALSLITLFAAIKAFSDSNHSYTVSNQSFSGSYPHTNYFQPFIKHTLRLISFTGRHSLIYYFLCGGVPLLLSRQFTIIGFPYRGSYISVLLLFLLVYLVTTTIVWCFVKARNGEIS